MRPQVSPTSEIHYPDSSINGSQEKDPRLLVLPHHEVNFVVEVGDLNAL